MDARNRGTTDLRKTVFIIAAALLGAAAATALSGPRPLDAHALDLELERALPRLAGELAAEPAPVRAAFVGWAGDRQLVLSARLALLRHPAMTRSVLETFGADPMFAGILREHGPAVVPPVHYFMLNELPSLRLRAMVAGWILPGEPAADPGTREARVPAAADHALTPRERGEYAIAFIRADGHDFLGQFVTTADGDVAWVQSERFATATKHFFTSGITELESKWHLGEERTAADYGWAGVDILLPVVALKAARFGKLAARSGKATRTSARLAQAGTATARVARLGRTAAKVGVVAGAGYLVLNPGVISSIGDELGGWMGIPGWLVTGGLWFGLLLPVLLVLGCANRWLLRPARRLTGWLIAALAWLHRKLEPRSARERFTTEAAPTDR